MQISLLFLFSPTLLFLRLLIESGARHSPITYFKALVNVGLPSFVMIKKSFSERIFEP